MISIIIVNFNGKKWLPGCLGSLRAQTYRDFEIILVDNNSSDGSFKFVQENYPEVKLIQSGANLGFAGGNNLGYAQARGEYILLLNNDIEVATDFLENFLAGFAANPKLGSAQSKIVLADNHATLDLCGSYWTDTSFLFHYGFRKDASLPQYNLPQLFFSNKGASMMLRREAIEKSGGLFDDAFWCYYEETDLCHRLWLHGYEVGYIPEALAFHFCGATAKTFANSFIQFHNFKNKLRSFLKILEVRPLWRVLPVYLLTNVLISIAWLLTGKWRHSVAIYQSWWWNVTHWSETKVLRGEIQAARVVSDEQVFARTRKNPRWSYYYYLFMNPRKYEE